MHMKALRIELAIQIIQWTLTAVLQLARTLFIKIKRDCKHDRKEVMDSGWKISSIPASGSTSENRSKKTWFKLCVHFLSRPSKQTKIRTFQSTQARSRRWPQVVNVRPVWKPLGGLRHRDRHRPYEWA